MVEVTVKFYGQLQEVVNEKIRQVTLQHCDVEDLINTLIKDHGEKLKEKLIDAETNQITDRLVMFVNGMNIKGLKGAKTELKEGDLIAFFPPGGGG